VTAGRQPIAAGDPSPIRKGGVTQINGTTNQQNGNERWLLGLDGFRQVFGQCGNDPTLADGARIACGDFRTTFEPSATR
jgi:hypothetical protein